MMVLVDTCVWSLALRRQERKDDPEVRELETLIRDGRVQLIGPIRQEILSGIARKAQFDRIRLSLAAFPDLPIEAEDHELAASYYNLCRSKGIQGSNTDFLICSVGVRHELEIYTTDADFELFEGCLPIVLHRVQASPAERGSTGAG
jgi:predicted nucleic acid-binding protein